jgi:cytoskeleton protein RodZ
MTQTIGQQLKEIRESRGISLEEVAQKTRIRLAYLEALESGDVEALPSRSHLRGFLRLYANELGVSIDELQVAGYHLSEPQQDPILTAPSKGAEAPQAKPTEQHKPHPASEPVADSKPDPESDQPKPEKIIAATKHTTDANELQQSTKIFKSIGEQLRTRRELLSLSIDAIHQNTRIQKEKIQALEAGCIDQLTSPVQAKGLLTNYAAFLNLDIDSLLLNFADGLQTQRLEKQNLDGTQQNHAAREISSTKLQLKNFFSLDLLVTAALFIGFATFVIWGVNRIMDIDSPETIPTQLPEVADILLATGSPTPDLGTSLDEEPLDDEAGEDQAPQNDEQTGDQPSEDEEPLIIPALGDSPINLIIIPGQRTWVQVTSDSELVFEGRLLPGNAYEYSGQETIEILTGNAGALQIFFNEQDIGTQGLIGQVASLVFTETGLVQPTPTNTPTITETPETTPTPSETPTPTPTETDD